MSEKKLLNYGALLFFGIAFQQMISFLISIYAGKILSVDEFGTLQILRTLLGYSTLYALGIPIAFMYDLPKEISLKNNKIINKIETNLFSISTLSLIFLPFGILFYFLDFTLNGEPIGNAWFIVGLIIFAESMRARSTLLLRSYQSFKWLSYLNLIYPLIYAPVGYFSIKYFKLEGFLWSAFISSLLVYLVSLRFINRINYFSFDFNYLISKIKVGLPIKIGSLIWAFSIAGGLYIISDAIGSFETGIYGFSMLCGTALMVLPTVINEIFTPKIIGHFTLNEKKGRINFEIIYWGIILLISVGFLSSILALVFFDYLIILLLPKYLPALSLIAIFVVGYFSSLTKGFTRDYLILKNEQNTLLIFDTIILIIVFASQLVSGYIFNSIHLIVVSTSVGLFLMSFIPLLYYLKKYAISHKLKLINTVIFSCLAMIPLVYFLHNFIVVNEKELMVTIIPISFSIFFGLYIVIFAFKKFFVLMSDKVDV